MPNDAFGALVKTGESIFTHTRAMAPDYVCNELSCANCHLDRGRLAYSAPLWGAYPGNPAFRKKTNQVNTFAERMQGCFAYRMNGKPPLADGKIMNALTSYAFWLSTGAPVGKSAPGRGYDPLPPPAGGYSLARGQAIYGEKCALWHGDGGDIEKTRVRFREGDGVNLYGQTVNVALLGQGVE